MSSIRSFLRGRSTAAAVVLAMALPTASAAQEAAAPAEQSATAAAMVFLGGAATAFAAHEAGHVVFDVAFDANPGVRRVEFHGIPFFAVTHDTLPRRQELAVSYAGFWVQQATSEWILTRQPDLRRRRAPFAKGMLAFNVGAAAAYAGAAFARTGPPERDTRGIAVSAGLDERWVGAVILAPAVLDTWRYFDPGNRWLVWAARAAKVGGVFLLAK
jgi:hypothetical protein